MGEKETILHEGSKKDLKRQKGPQVQAIHLYHDDIPEDLVKKFPKGVAVALDTEATGLKPTDRLCLIQFSLGDGICYLVKVGFQPKPAPHLKAFLTDPSRDKLMHYARFDVGILYRKLNIMCGGFIYCTKTASRLARTYTERHGLKEICRELLGIDLCKVEQSSYWGAETLTDAQKAYAASDVLYLHDLQEKLDYILAREGREALFRAACGFLPYRVMLDVAGFHEDIFAHHIPRVAF